VVLAVFAVGAVVVVAAGRRYGTTAPVRWGCRVVAAVMLAVQLGVIVHSNLPSQFGLDHSLPLHLSDLVVLVAAYALWTYGQRTFALTYYWGLVLSVQALFSPALSGPDFPGKEFLAFWSLHLFVVWTAIYLTWGVGLRPAWRDYRLVVVVSFGWAAVAMVVNWLTGANYGFLNRKPTIGSVLDVLGPWPWYLLPEIALVLTVWALMTWPWTRSSKLQA
jgi:hypothetical integral membrane protein (TIGR02206 family)